VELDFTVTDAARMPYAAGPTLSFTLRIDAAEDADVRSILLDTQIQIAARRRAYDEHAEQRLFELFGRPADWGRTLRTLLWTHVTTVVPPFRGSTVIDLAVPCSYDLEVAASRYFDALADGAVPLEFLFSGTVFTGDGPGGGLQARRISWEQDAEYALPVAVWKETLDRHFAGTAWLRVGKDRFDRLAAYKAEHALASWDEALDALLPEEAATWTT
jgi:Family of unknown function (DUF6084)